jgi:tetratricopeptide (TPR) repeat protein
MKRYLVIFWIFVLVFAASCKSKGNSAEQYMNEGAKLFEKQKYDAAIEQYQKAIELEPKSAVVYNLLGMAYRFKYNQMRNKEYFDKEIESFKKSIELDPNFWVAMINLASSYYYDDQKDKAIPLFKKALEINPEHPEKENIKKLIEEYEKSGTE